MAKSFHSGGSVNATNWSVWSGGSVYTPGYPMISTRQALNGNRPYSYHELGDRIMPRATTAAALLPRVYFDGGDVRQLGGSRSESSPTRGQSLPGRRCR